MNIFGVNPYVAGAVGIVVLTLAGFGGCQYVRAESAVADEKRTALKLKTSEASLKAEREGRRRADEANDATRSPYRIFKLLALLPLYVMLGCAAAPPDGCPRPPSHLLKPSEANFRQRLDQILQKGQTSDPTSTPSPTKPTNSPPAAQP